MSFMQKLSYPAGGGTDAALAPGSIPIHPKVNSPVYKLHPEGLLETFPTLNDRLARPRVITVPYGHWKSLMEDWRLSLRALSFIDTVAGAMATLALQTGSTALVTLAAALGNAIGDSGKLAAHGYLSSLIVIREHVLHHNKGEESLSREDKTVRLAPPLHPELLPGALIDEAQVLAMRRQKAEQAALGTLAKGVQSLASRGGHQPQRPQHFAQQTQQFTHPKPKHGRGGGRQRSRGGGRGHTRGQAQGGAMPGRGRGADTGSKVPPFHPNRGARGGAPRGNRR